MKYLRLWPPGLRNVFWKICKTLRPPPLSYILNVHSLMPLQLPVEGLEHPRSRLNNTTVCNLKDSVLGQIHALSRSQNYPMTKIDRYPVSDEVVPWEVSYHHIYHHSIKQFKGVHKPAYCYSLKLNISKK